MIKYNKWMRLKSHNTMVSWFVLGLPLRGGFRKYVKWPWNIIHLMSCRLDIHVAFTCSIAPSSVMWSEVGPTPHFFTNESTWSAMVSRAPSVVCDVALSTGICGYSLVLTTNPKKIFYALIQLWFHNSYRGGNNTNMSSIGWRWFVAIQVLHTNSRFLILRHG